MFNKKYIDIICCGLVLEEKASSLTQGGSGISVEGDQLFKHN